MSERDEQPGPVATIACCGPRSCGWSNGLWLEVEAMEQVWQLMEQEAVLL